MNILTKKNGIALMGVMAMLLILTLLLPAMYTMSDGANRRAQNNIDILRASYLARSMVEMSVSAYEDYYDGAQEEIEENKSVKPYNTAMEKFYAAKEMHPNPIYMLVENGTNEDIMFPDPKDEEKYDLTTEEGIAEWEEDYAQYCENGGVKYVAGTYDSDGNPVAPSSIEGYTVLGVAECKLTYLETCKYYHILEDGTSEEITENEYNTKKSEIESSIKIAAATSETYNKVESKTVTFLGTATVNDKSASRRSVLVLPTKPAENNWIVPANLESNQIFVDSKKCTGLKVLKYTETKLDGLALRQPVYIFSCLGNMDISLENIQYKDEHGNYIDLSKATIDGVTALPNAISDYSLGVHPVTATRNPDNDPTFNCIKTNNMQSWAISAQRDNFVAFTASNTIEVGMPISLVINPCRTARIGDGYSNNESLYKMMYFQAPNIVFKGRVNSMISLYWNTSFASTIASAIQSNGSSLIDYNAYRMTSLVFAAPASTPYSYDHAKYGTVKAGKVYFVDDAYIWVIPVGSNGSNYKTQTVYYKNKDIKLYKIANAGDIYYFNNEIQSTVDGVKQNTGFSLTGYFMDVIYPDMDKDEKWYDVWEKGKNYIFDQKLKNGEKTYVKDDFKWVGNIYDDIEDSVPTGNDFYVIWDS